MAGLIGVETTYLFADAWKRTTQFLGLPKGSPVLPRGVTIGRVLFSTVRISLTSIPPNLPTKWPLSGGTRSPLFDPALIGPMTDQFGDLSNHCLRFWLLGESLQQPY